MFIGAHFVESGVAAKYAPENEGLADAGWHLVSGMFMKVKADVDVEALQF